MGDPLSSRVRRSSKRRALVVAALFVALTSTQPTASEARALSAKSITLFVDATDVQHGIAHARLKIPVQPGAVTLAYPKWIPGEHEPNGAITQLMDIHMRADGHELSWTRESDPFMFHVQVPRGVHEVDVSLAYYSPPISFGSGFAKSPSILPQLMILPFNEFLLYPHGTSPEVIGVDATVRLPSGWMAKSSAADSKRGDELRLAHTNVARLIDSPVLAAPSLLCIEIAGGRTPVSLVLASSAPSIANPPAKLMAALRRLVPETMAVFGRAPFRHYDWLVSLDGALRQDGTEHAESSDIRQSPALFRDPDQVVEWVLFPHEFVHAWNGKFRRPRGLVAHDLQAPMRDDLLWVYEGLTRYYADFVLAARSGIWAPSMSRDYLAFVADQMEDQRPGRRWRSLADTARAVPSYTDAPQAWSSIRRGADYYNEMLLVWLEADMEIRSRTHGKRSLDDFARLFFGSSNGIPTVSTYSRGDLVKGLNSILPWDWQQFFKKRLEGIAHEAPLKGVELSGWRLVWNDTPNSFKERVERISGTWDLGTSLGLWIAADGTVEDVAPSSPAFAAGLAPGAKIIAVENRPWSIDALKDALLSAEHGRESAIELSFERYGQHRSVEISYRGGLKYPHLVRNSSATDSLSLILEPTAPPQVFSTASTKVQRVHAFH